LLILVRSPIHHFYTPTHCTLPHSATLSTRSTDPDKSQTHSTSRYHRKMSKHYRTLSPSDHLLNVFVGREPKRPRRIDPMSASRTRQHTVFQDFSVLPAFSSVDYIAAYRLQHQPDNTARSWIDAVAGMLQLHQARPQHRLEI
jgi:hypothetical protein